MSRHPVKGSVRENEIDRRVRLPGFNVFEHPLPVRMLGLGLSQHFLRIVHTSNASVWPARTQLLRAVARAATQIDDVRGSFNTNLRDQISRRPRALIGILQI